MKAIWKDQIIAQSDNIIIVEGNHYFPADSLNDVFFTKTSHTSVCPWKGTAEYFSITVGGETNVNAAWVYPNAKEAASNIRGYVAFWKGVDVVA